MSSLLTLQHDIVYKVLTLGLCDYEKSHKDLQYLNVFMILCCARFIAILEHTWPMGHGLDVP